VGRGSLSGVFSHRSAVELAAVDLGDATITTSYLRDGAAACRRTLAKDNQACLADYPDPRALAGMDLIVLDNVPATALSWEQRRQLREFVRSGGSLLVLGGWYALSKGSYEGSFIEEALPVRVRQSNYLRRLRPEQGVIQPTAGFAGIMGIESPGFPAAASVEWVNHVQVRPGARVLLTAGEHPLLVAGGFGQGRVMVWTGSYSGEPASPYWQSGGWQALLTQALTHLCAGSEAKSPADPEALARVERLKARYVDAALDSLFDQPVGGEDQRAVLPELLAILSLSRSEDALFVARYLLEQPTAVSPEDYGQLVSAIGPLIEGNADWAALGASHLKNPPLMLEDLVGRIFAAGAAQASYGQIEALGVRDPRVRLQAIAATRDPAALPDLRAMLNEIGQQEAHWRELAHSGQATPQSVGDLYRTHLLRPFVAQAMLRCGQRDEATLRALCEGSLALPYYAWRQRWVREQRAGAVATLEQSGVAGSRLADARAALKHADAAIEQLDAACAQLPRLLHADVVGTDATALQIAARAIASTDCRRSLPIALGFLKSVPRKHFSAMSTLEQAALPEVGRYFDRLQ